MTITGRLWLTSISFDARSSSNSNLFDKITISENKSSKSDKLNIDMANSQAQKIDAIKNIPLTEKIIITSVLSFTSRDCINYRKAVCEKASHCMSMYLFSPPAFENKFIYNKLSSKLSIYFILPSRLTRNCLCKFTRKHNELIGQTILMDSCWRGKRDLLPNLICILCLYFNWKRCLDSVVKQSGGCNDPVRRINQQRFFADFWIIKIRKNAKIWLMLRLTRKQDAVER